MTDLFPISISNAHLEDLPEILSLFRQTVTTVCIQDYNKDQLNAWVSSANDTDKWKRKIEEHLFLLTRKGNQLVGFASFKKPNYLDLFFVDHEHQGKNIGSQLYETLETTVREMGVGIILADVSITAKPFFDKQGFEVVKENKVHLNEQVLNNYTMQKSV